MKLRELSLQELQETYGGADASATGIGLSGGTDTLLTLNYQFTMGNKSYQYKLEIGKDVNFNLFNNKAS